MPKDLHRYYGQGHLHFLTFSCYQRRPLLDNDAARDVFVEALNEIRDRYHFSLFGYVLMPEHVHLLISESPPLNPSDILKVLKQRVARDLRRMSSNPADLSLKELARFWQPRFHDFNVYSSAKIREKLEYMHRNPVARRLVAHPEDWPWSSWSFYAKGEVGLIKIDPIKG